MWHISKLSKNGKNACPDIRYHTGKIGPGYQAAKKHTNSFSLTKKYQGVGNKKPWVFRPGLYTN